MHGLMAVRPPWAGLRPAATKPSQPQRRPPLCQSWMPMVADIFGLSSKGAELGSASTRNHRPGTTWEPRLDVRVSDHKYDTGGMSHHLQERLANVRTLPFNMG